MSAATLRRIQWSDAKKAVRELLVAVFTTPVLKVSSMTGKPSNGNKYRQSGGGVRPSLDQEKLGDVKQAEQNNDVRVSTYQKSSSAS